MYRRKATARPSRIIFSLISDGIIRVTAHKLFSNIYGPLCKHLGETKASKSFTITYSRYAQAIDFCKKHNINHELLPPHVEALRASLQKQKHGTIEQDRIHTKLWETLFPYQRSGCEKMVTHFHGRAYLGDEMGLGKTYQALFFLHYYRQNKRALLICPSYLRYHWAHEIEHWFGWEAQVVLKGRDELTGSIVIISYDLVTRVKMPENFHVVILDESHYAKNRKAKRTKAIIPIVKRTPKALLLSGTPALNRPVELFTQLHMLRPKYMPKYTKYALRYCDGKHSWFGFDDTGVSNQEELYYILTNKYMIRRLKRDVLTELPPKKREEIWFRPSVTELREVSQLQAEYAMLVDEMQALRDGTEAKRKKMFEIKVMSGKLWRATATAKTRLICAWIKDILENNNDPIIIFCYHKVMMDAVEATLECPFMRIDGSTPPQKRVQNVNEFQTNKECRVALLSIGAAATGITLTRSAHVVFAEMYWVPGVMIQAEDRAHRISQTRKVLVQYLLAKDTMDEKIFPTICKKLRTLDSVMDQRTDRTLKGDLKDFQPDEEVELF